VGLLRGQSGRASQELEAKGQESCASPVDQKAKVADADEAGGNQLQQEAAQELLDRKGIKRCWLPCAESLQGKVTWLPSRETKQ